MKNKLFTVLLLLISSVLSYAQVVEQSPNDYFKTISFFGYSEDSTLPIIKLGDPIILEFDILNGNEDDYYYKITHYNYDWTPSVLIQSEYLDGFNDQRILDYENSFNTYQIYSHYKLSIPNQNTKGVRVSGNYLLAIYNKNNELMFSRKFMVYEDLANVGVQVKRSRNLDFIEQKQRVDISVVPSKIFFNNPKQTVNVAIVQNGNLKTAITHLKPLYTIGNQLIYKYDNETSFWGGNEYLYFENKDVRTANSGVHHIELKELYHNYLFTNTARYNQPYTYNPDINGKFVTTLINAENPKIEADYVWIHFSLKADELFKNKSVYVYGNFNNFIVDEGNLMTYDEKSNTYKTSLLLKQGFYNYKYVLKNSAGVLDENAISGSFYQTENEYHVIVYYRDLGARYDKIVGIGEGSSINISN